MADHVSRFPARQRSRGGSLFICSLASLRPLFLSCLLAFPSGFPSLPSTSIYLGLLLHSCNRVFPLHVFLFPCILVLFLRCSILSHFRIPVLSFLHILLAILFDLFFPSSQVPDTSVPVIWAAYLLSQPIFGASFTCLDNVTINLFFSVSRRSVTNTI